MADVDILDLVRHLISILSGYGLYFLIRISIPPIWGFSRASFGPAWDILTIWIFGTVLRLVSIVSGSLPTLAVYFLSNLLIQRFFNIETVSPYLRFLLVLLFLVLEMGLLCKILDDSYQIQEKTEHFQKYLSKINHSIPGHFIQKTRFYVSSEGSLQGNAITYGGGVVHHRIVFSEKFAENFPGDALAGVIFHEYGHIVRNDSLITAFVFGQLALIEKGLKLFYRMLIALEKIPIIHYFAGLIRRYLYFPLEKLFIFYRIVVKKIDQIQSYFTEQACDTAAVSFGDPSYMLMGLVSLDSNEKLMASIPSFGQEKERFRWVQSALETYFGQSQSRWYLVSYSDLKSLLVSTHPLIQSRLAWVGKIWSGYYLNHSNQKDLVNFIPISRVVVSLVIITFLAMMTISQINQSSKYYNTIYKPLIEKGK